MRPVMCGCTAQKYSYVPARSNRRENVSSVSSAGELNCLSLAVTVCGTSSRFVHITVLPAATVTSAGEYEKLSIDTFAVRWSLPPPPPPALGAGDFCEHPATTNTSEEAAT